MKSNTIKGTPGPILLPAKRWEWKFVDGPKTMDVPCSSVFVGEEEKGKNYSVKLNHADDMDVWVNFGVLTKSLFSNSVYPELKENQVFSISSIILDSNKDVVTVVGNILERV